MMQPAKARAAAIAVATGAALVMTSGVAYAFWRTAGSGAGAAAAGTAQALNLAAASASGNMLYPGGNGEVVITITNPNPFAVSVDSLTLPTTAAAQAYNEAALSTLDSACNTGGTGVTWAYPSKSLSGVIVAKKVGLTSGTLTLTLTNGAAMSNASDNNCQGGFFKMADVTAVVASSSTGTPVASISQ